MKTENPLTESYPALPVSDDLRLRVARLAAQSEAKTNKPAPRRWVLAATCAAVALLGTVALTPRLATANTLSRMSAALDGVRTVHLIRWQAKSVSDPTREKSEQWFLGEAVRREDSRGILVYRDGKRYHFNPQRNRVVVEAAKGAGQFNNSGFSIKSMAADIARWGWKDKIETLSPSLVSITRDEAAGKVRILITVDPKTDLPQSYELALLKNGQWENFGNATLRYNEPLDDALFSGEFPGATVIDSDQEKRHWQQAVEETVTEAKVGERTVRIRDLRVNEKGAIFVLYTCGKTYRDAFSKTKIEGRDKWWPGGNRDWEVSLTAADGTRYEPQVIPFEGIVDSTIKRASLGNRPVLKDGELIQGDWFIPLSPQPKAPESVRLQVKTTSGKGVLTVRPTVQAGFLPDYWASVVALHGADEASEKELRRLFESTRAGYLEEQRSTLPQALAALEAASQLDPEVQPFRLLQKARVLGYLGRTAEAKATLAQALPLVEKLKDKWGAIHHWKAVGAAAYAMNDEAQARAALDKVLADSYLPSELKKYRNHPEALRRDPK